MQQDPSPRLRAVEPSDIDFLYRLENLPDVWRVSWGDAPVSRQLLWEYIQGYTADIYADRQLQMVIELDGHPVGTVDITDYNPRQARAMVGVAVDPAHRGRGIASAALRQAIAMCRDTFAMHQLCALVPKDNAPSLRLFESLGFKTSGCLRSWVRRSRTPGADPSGPQPQQWVDVVVYQLLFR